MQRTSRRISILVVLCIVIAGCAFAQIPSGPYRIAGTVINAKAGGPLSRSRVTIADAKNRQSMQSVITGDDGRFEFHVPAGKYSIEGAKRGFISGSYNQHEQFSSAIVTGADFDTENLALRLPPNAVLTGQVLDEFGEPVRNAQIAVYRESNVQGMSRIFHFRGAMTDDEGRYEVTPLNEGTYFVSASAAPWYAIHPAANSEGTKPSPASQVDSSLDVAYPITYYGDVTEADDATPIPVRGGDRLEADIHVNPAPALHLIVHAPQNNEGITMPMLTKSSFDGQEQVQNSTMQNVAPGVFELTGVAAGRYMVRMPDSGGQMKEPTEVNLSGGSDLDVSSGRSTSKIKAGVQIEGSENVPTQLQIGLRSSKGRLTTAALDAKGEAHFDDVIPGKYEVVAFTQQQQGYAIVRIAAEAGTTSGHALTVPPGASLNVLLSLAAGSASVEGFAKHAGKGASGAMIVLVPKNPEENLDRFRRDQSDLDGSFTLPGVIPGAYTIVAIDNGWDLDWSQPAVLARYLEHGQTINVADSSAAVMRLPAPVDVQTK